METTVGTIGGKATIFQKSYQKQAQRIASDSPLRAKMMFDTSVARKLNNFPKVDSRLRGCSPLIVILRGALKTVMIGLSLLFPLAGVFSAEPGSVVINEIAWMGTKLEGIEQKNWWRYEWLELYNNTKQAILLDGWHIELSRLKPDWTLELKGTIPAEGYFLIVASDKIFPTFDLNYSNLGGKFINSGQKIVLKDNLGGIIDSVDCFSAGRWFAGNNETKQTMERKNSRVTGQEENNWQTSENVNGTPGAKNSLGLTVQSGEKEKIQDKQPVPTYPENVFINEVLPAPEGPDAENEWIELFNGNNFEINLVGWQLRDKVGVTTSYIFGTEARIAANGFLVYPRRETKIVLQNQGDGLELLNPKGEVVAKISFEKAPKNQSFNRTMEGDFTWSTTLTPARANIITQQEIPKTKFQQNNKQKGDGANGSKLFHNKFLQIPETNSMRKSELSDQIKKEEVLAKVSQNFPKTLNFFWVILTAVVVAVFSAIIVLILKKNISNKKI